MKSVRAEPREWQIGPVRQERKKALEKHLRLAEVFRHPPLKGKLWTDFEKTDSKN